MQEAFASEPLVAGFHGISKAAKAAGKATKAMKKPAAEVQTSKRKRAVGTDEWQSSTIVKVKCSTAKAPARSYLQGMVDHPTESGKWKLIVEVREAQTEKHKELIQRLKSKIEEQGLSRVKVRRLVQETATRETCVGARNRSDQSTDRM